MVIKKYQGKDIRDALSQATRELGKDAVLIHTRTLKKSRFLGLGGPTVEVTVTDGKVDRLRGRNRRLETKPMSKEMGAKRAALQAYAQKTLQEKQDAANAQSQSPQTSAAPQRQRTTAAGTAQTPASPLANRQERAVDGVINEINQNRMMATAKVNAATAASMAQPRDTQGTTATQEAKQPPQRRGTARQSEQAIPSRPSGQQTKAQRDRIGTEVREMKHMLKELINLHRKDAYGDMPAELLPYYTQLIDQDVKEELARSLVRRIASEVGEEYLSDEKLVREKFIQTISGLINVSGPIQVKRGETRVISFVGPTGVGKTTTIAKLAANLKLKEDVSVGLLTIDTFRIAAVDQLKQYAQILDVPIRVVSRPQQIQEAIIQLGACDVILVDTAGRSHRDYEKMGDLADFLTEAKPDEVHLVLSTTTTPKAMDRIVESFSYCHIDKVVFTKLDEALSHGVMLNVMGKVNQTLSYVTTGQNVPEDIEEGDARLLAERILS